MSALGTYYPEHRDRRALRRDIRRALQRTIGLLAANGEVKQIDVAHTLLKKLGTTNNDNFMAILATVPYPRTT